MPTKSHSERRKRFETSSGIDLPADFNPTNTEPVDYDKNLNSPGDFPYTRGIYSNMYRGRLWTMRQYAGFATAQESNQRYKYLLSQGITGLTTANGRFTILMPHPERVWRTAQMSWHPDDWGERSPWYRMFANARRFVG